MIGKDVPRVDVPSKVTGAAKYAIDVQVPGMVYAAVLQSPYPRRRAGIGGRCASVASIPGITDIVKLPDGVGVIGIRVEATQAAKQPAQGDLVEVRQAPTTTASARWNNSPPIARDKSRDGVPYDKRRRQGGDDESAARVFRGEYRTRYVYHAQMEPLSATASGQRRRQVGGNLGGHPGADRPLNQVARLSADRPQQASRCISICSAAGSAAAASRK